MYVEDFFITDSKANAIQKGKISSLYTGHDRLGSSKLWPTSRLFGRQIYCSYQKIIGTFTGPITVHALYDVLVIPTWINYGMFRDLQDFVVLG